MFEYRSYQVSLAQKAYQKILNGRNVVIDLPTGAGKTNVALLVVLKLLRSPIKCKKKVLFVVPNRTLINQVARASAWASGEVKLVEITPGLVNNSHNLKVAILTSDLIITTPGLFASRLERNPEVRELFLSTIGLAIVDEFDDFLMREMSRFGFTTRFEVDYGRLEHFIDSTPKLLMSATAPTSIEKYLQNNDTAHALSKFVNKHFKPLLTSVPEAEYQRFIPVANVQLIGCQDIYVQSCEQAVSLQFRNLIEEFSCSNYGAKLDIEFFLSGLDQIASGSLYWVRLSSGGFVPATKEIKKLARRLLSTRNKYSFLYEDMFADIYPEEQPIPSIVNCHEEFIHGYKLVDNRSTNEFFPLLRSKSVALLSILASHIGEKGVLFTRNTRLSDKISEYLNEKKIPNLILDGRIINERERLSIIDNFRTGESDVLIITRHTGRRGLDLPMADYAIFYSPKTDEYVVWQELSRIRSTIGDVKPSYVLFYSGTSEEQRLKKLEVALKSSPHRYNVSWKYFLFSVQS
jgi:superfamily II DNA/RNA helicase